MTKLTNEEIEQLRNIRIHTLLNLQTSNRRVSLRCPFPNHNDSTPSFVLYPQNNFYCFGCGANGQGAIDFCMALGYTFVEACEELVRYIRWTKNRQYSFYRLWYRWIWGCKFTVSLRLMVFGNIQTDALDAVFYGYWGWRSS